MLVDTHCHIHEPSYPLDSDDVLQRAHTAGVAQLICVGTSEKSSREAVEFALRHENVFAAVGVHPHDTKDGWGEIGEILDSSFYHTQNPATPPPETRADLRHEKPATTSLSAAELATTQTSSLSQEAVTGFPGQFDSVPGRGVGRLPASDFKRARQPQGDALKKSSRSPAGFTKHLQPETEPTPGLDVSPGAKPFRETSGRKGEQDNTIVAIGEIGLDYFYIHSPRETQIQALEAQIDLALRHNLPVIFHVREAFDDFWPIFDNFQGIRGELHSFTDTEQHMDEALKRGLLIGVNGISTFTKDKSQRVMFSHIPLEKLLLETDAPFLTPVPFRGKVNEPAFVKNIAQYHAEVRNLSLEEIAAATTTNARALFALR